MLLQKAINLHNVGLGDSHFREIRHGDKILPSAASAVCMVKQKLETVSSPNSCLNQSNIIHWNVSERMKLSQSNLRIWQSTKNSLIHHIEGHPCERKVDASSTMRRGHHASAGSLQLCFEVGRGEDASPSIPGPSGIPRDLARDVANPGGYWEDLLPEWPFWPQRTTWLTFPPSFL